MLIFGIRKILGRFDVGKNGKTAALFSSKQLV